VLHSAGHPLPFTRRLDRGAGVDGVLNMSTELLSRVQLALKLGVTPRTIATWDAMGLIPRIKIGNTVRYSLEDVIAWSKRCEPKQGAK
jgi:hypothetical protein